MTQNTENVKKVKKYCPSCMGFVFFMSNKNTWRLETCDGCGQYTRVKPQPQEAEKESPRPSFKKRPVAQKKEENSGFWKTLEKVFVALSA
jgi:hypothetical protein